MRRVEINWPAFVRREKGIGLFQGWGLRKSPDPVSHQVVTCAIVELDDGKIKLVDPELIQFLDPPPESIDG